MNTVSNKQSKTKGKTLILGFFDGIHAGHRNVIDKALKTNNETVLLTFPQSPAEYFGTKSSYIYTREHSYKLIKALGVDNIIEKDFSFLANISAESYLESIIQNYNPEYIVTGFNHTFGANRQGQPEFLKSKQEKYNYTYICTEPFCIENEVVSSTKIKDFLANGEIEKANKFLQEDFCLSSCVIEGSRIARTLGFPTANLRYPDKIIKIPYGVYKVEVLNMPAIMNWGIKPTFGNNEEVLEVHIPNYNADLYNKELEISIKNKIRPEKRFLSKEELVAQIKKDVQECLK